MPKTKEEFEQKIAAREAEVRSIADEFNARQAQFRTEQQQRLDTFQQYAAQTQQRASHIEGMILQLREDMTALTAEETLPEEPVLT